ncbi:MAG: hypothetical protein ABIA63_02870 [bacterium]
MTAVNRPELYNSDNSNENCIFEIQASNVVVEGLIFNGDISGSVLDIGIIAAGENVVVSKCAFQNFDYGVMGKGGYLVVENSTFQEMEQNCVRFRTSGTTPEAIEGWRILHNTACRNSTSLSSGFFKNNSSQSGTYLGFSFIAANNLLYNQNYAYSSVMGDIPDRTYYFYSTVIHNSNGTFNFKGGSEHTIEEIDTKYLDPMFLGTSINNLSSYLKPSNSDIYQKITEVYSISTDFNNTLRKSESGAVEGEFVKTLQAYYVRNASGNIIAEYKQLENENEAKVDHINLIGAQGVDGNIHYDSEGDIKFNFYFYAYAANPISFYDPTGELAKPTEPTRPTRSDGMGEEEWLKLMEQYWQQMMEYRNLMTIYQRELAREEELTKAYREGLIGENEWQAGIGKIERGYASLKQAIESGESGGLSTLQMSKEQMLEIAEMRHGVKALGITGFAAGMGVGAATVASPYVLAQGIKTTKLAVHSTHHTFKLLGKVHIYRK